MSAEGCAHHLLTQAELDGELSPAEAAALATHRELCADCTLVSAALRDLSAALRRDAPYYAIPDDLKARLQAQAGVVRPLQRRRLTSPALAFAAGAALAACMTFALLPREPGLAAQVEAAHVRALQPGHLLDVPSTDTHQVKPWFDGRLDFAPPVIDLAKAGFPLTGGRLDYLAGRPVAALVYGRRQHVIDLFVWPQTGSGGPVEAVRSGYNVVSWNEGGMAFWAVSDVSAGELATFVMSFRNEAR